MTKAKKLIIALIIAAILVFAAVRFANMLYSDFKQAFCKSEIPCAVTLFNPRFSAFIVTF